MAEVTARRWYKAPTKYKMKNAKRLVWACFAQWGVVLRARGRPSNLMTNSICRTRSRGLILRLLLNYHRHSRQILISDYWRSITDYWNILKHLKSRTTNQNERDGVTFIQTDNFTVLVVLTASAPIACAKTTEYVKFVSKSMPDQIAQSKSILVENDHPSGPL